MIKKKEIIIWDQIADPIFNQNILLWNKRSKKLDSIINFIDNNSKKIKSDVLDLLGNFGKSKIDNLDLINFYKLETGMSYWKLSFFVEKNFYKKNFFEILKICALVALIKKKKFSKITLYTSNNNLIEFFKNFCSTKKIDLIIKSIDVKNKSNINKTLKGFQRILVFIFKRLNFKKNILSKHNIFFSYFENNDSNLKKSIYWDQLFNKIQNKEIIQIFLPSKNYPNIRKIKNKNLNFLDYEFNILILIKILFSFFKINIQNRKVNNLGNKIFISNSINFWPIIKPYWEDSFKSINLFKNLYYYHLFKSIIFKKIHNHKNLFYLFENQPWERCLCFFYKKKFKKTKLVGISHTPIRFWDLRFFNSKKINLKDCSPNNICFVNRYSQNIYKRDFNDQKKVKLEALRYNDFNIKFNNKKKKKKLIIGDYLDSENILIKSLIQKVSSINKKNILYLVHPANPKKIDRNFTYLISKKDLNKFNIDRVFIPHMSTSVIEYLLNNKDVIIFLNDNMPNMSPIFMSKSKFNYVFDLKSLNENLSKKKHILNYKLDQFKPLTNKKLIYWKKLLSNDFKE